MSEAISDDALRKLLELESIASPGPWRHYRSGDTFAVGQSTDGRPAYGCHIEDIACVEDAAFVAAARNALRPLVEEVLRLRQSLAFHATEKLSEEVAALRSALLASENEARLLREELSQTMTVPDCVMPVRCSMGVLERREE